MALLSQRQQTARALADELSKLGAFVLNPMPLDDNKRLRIQILECDRNKVFQAVSDYGFGVPAFVNMQPRITYNGMALAAVYEIDLPRERQPVPDDRKIHGELATGEKPPPSEMQLIVDEWYAKKRRQRW
jgi:hypothetical protein